MAKSSAEAPHLSDSMPSPVQLMPTLVSKLHEPLPAGGVSAVFAHLRAVAHLLVRYAFVFLWSCFSYNVLGGILCCRRGSKRL